MCSDVHSITLISPRWQPNVTVEKLCPDRDSNPGSFAGRANNTTELPSHLVISPTTYHRKPPIYK